MGNLTAEQFKAQAKKDIPAIPSNIGKSIQGGYSAAKNVRVPTTSEIVRPIGNAAKWLYKKGKQLAGGE